MEQEEAIEKVLRFMIAQRFGEPTHPEFPQADYNAATAILTIYPERASDSWIARSTEVSPSIYTALNCDVPCQNQGDNRYQLLVKDSYPDTPIGSDELVDAMVRNFQEYPRELPQALEPAEFLALCNNDHNRAAILLTEILVKMRTSFSFRDVEQGTVDDKLHDAETVATAYLEKLETQIGTHIAAIIQERVDSLTAQVMPQIQEEVAKYRELGETVALRNLVDGEVTERVVAAETEDMKTWLQALLDEKNGPDGPPSAGR